MALGGLASGFGMVPGVSLPRCGRRDGGGVWCAVVVGPLCGGVGGLVLGCVVDAGGLVRRPPRRSRAGGCACVWGGVVWGVFVLAD